MLQSILEDVKREFRSGHMVTQIIIVNIVIWIAINIIKLLFTLLSEGAATPEIYYTIRDFFLISNSPLHVLTHPWAFITTNFIHEGFGHIFWNMLLFYWFGKIIGDLIGDRKILPMYLLSGIAGCLAYFIFMNTGFFGQGQITPALGASASVMGIILGSAVTSPNYSMNLILLGPVKLMYVAGALFLIDIFALSPGSGGPIAHLGGALFGAFFINQMRRGRDWSEPVNNLIDKIQNFAGSLRSDEERPVKKRKKRTSNNEPLSVSHQERVDQILEKIKQSGYDSLTAEEKEFLFLASKK